MGRKILETGSSGYLMGNLINLLAQDPDVEKITGVDIRPPIWEIYLGKDETGKFSYNRRDITHPSFVENFKKQNYDTVVHAAWTFNPTHDTKRQDRVDIIGTENVLRLVRENPNIKNIVYLGSTTCYGQIPENPSEPPFLQEEDWVKYAEEKRKKAAYPYSRNKAIVDGKFQEFAKKNPNKNVFWIRGAIVLGPHTRNIVTHIAKSPFTFGLFMFKVLGKNPPMQFVSEEDMTQILYRALMEKWTGVVNVAGDGVVYYSDVIKEIGRWKAELPKWILYPMCEILWRSRLGITKFPSSLINLIEMPWVASNERLKKQYGYYPIHSSLDALRQMAGAIKN